MWSDDIVMPTPGFNDDLRFATTLDPLEAQTLVAQASPLKLSSVPFCQGLPGSIGAVSILSDSSHSRVALLTNSGPLSERRERGPPRVLISWLKTSMMLGERILPATSIAKRSRANPSMTVRHFKVWPLAQASNTKSCTQP